MSFNYLSVEKTMSLPPYYFRGPTFTHQWVNTTHGFLEDQVSRPFYCSGSIQFTFRGQRHIYGLIINDPHDLTPAEDIVQIQKPMPFPDILPRNRTTTFGYNKALCLNIRLKPCLINYLWPDNDNCNLPPLWLHKEGFLEKDSVPSLVDDESGRVIITGGKPRVLTIWDFALIYKQPPNTVE